MYHASKRIGTSAENKVAGQLISLGCHIEFAPPSQFHDYDLKVKLPPPSNRVVTIEVKYDKMQANTGNIAIEYYNPRAERLSGITASRSDFWAICLDRPQNTWIVTRESLLNFFKSVQPLKNIDCAGDGNASLYIYPCLQIMDLGIPLDSPQILEFLEGVRP